MGSEEEDRIANAWGSSAPYWDKYRDRLRLMYAPLTDALLAAASIAPGHKVLDVAGGAGEPSLSIADRVGSDGCIVTTDVAGAMVAATGREAQRAGIGNLRCAVCSALALPFRGGSFDRSVCRLGAMFFRDIRAAAGEMSRVTKPGGRIAYVVWSGSDRTPFISVASEVLARFVAPDPEPPDALNAWRFAERGVLAGHMRDAGLVDISETPLAFDIALPIDFDEFWKMRIELSDTLREKVGRLDDAVAASLSEAVREATRSFFRSGTMRFPSGALVVAGSTASH